MGPALSRLRFFADTIRALAATYTELNARIAASPGLPLPDPTTSYWSLPPSPIAQHGATSEIPATADIVIIGSGITGASVARALLAHLPTLHIVMLEARDACSGATARNGGHITPVLYQEYAVLKQSLGPEEAKRVIRFRLAHLPALLRVVEEEGIVDDSQCRSVDSYDVFFNEDKFVKAKSKLEDYLEDIPEEKVRWKIVSAEDCIKRLQVASTVLGAIETSAGAVHPYRLVTSILAQLLAQHPSFSLYTHTPCTSISPSSSQYVVSTPKGPIQTPHVIHATNAWASHLLEPLRRKIVPIRGHMCAQRPGRGLGKWMGTRSFVFYPKEGGYDYLTQMPMANVAASNSGTFPSPRAELLFGGGIARGTDTAALMAEIGRVDDTEVGFVSTAYLAGALATYFEGSWGEEGRSGVSGIVDATISPSRVLKSWSGILAISADGHPWVGRIPAKLSGRALEIPVPSLVGDKDEEEFVDVRAYMRGRDVLVSAPTPSEAGEETKLAAPGEWIVAGFSGEGMVHAWLCGRALARMVLGEDVSGDVGALPSTDINLNDTDIPLPESFIISESRWWRANIEDLG